jgi:MSHA biogenesis protein MshN
MSLINQMLKNLEQRRAAAGTTSGVDVMTGLRSAMQAGRAYSHWIMGAIVVLILIIIGWLIGNKLSAPNVVQPTTVVAVKPVVARPSPVIKQQIIPTVITVQRLFVTGDGQNAQLHISLTGRTSYVLESSENQDEITLTLDNTNKAAAAQLLNSGNTLIKNVSAVDMGNNQLALKLNVAVGTQIQRLTLNGNNPAEFVLELTNPTSVKEVNTPTADDKQDQQAQPTTDNKVTADQTYQKALQLVDENNVPAAISTLKDLLTTTPDYADAREALVKLLLQQGQISDADNILHAGMEARPGYPPFVELQAHIMALEGEYANALATLQTVKPIMQDNPDYYAFMAALYQQVGNAQQAARLYNQLLKLRANDASWWLGLATALEASNQKNAALQAYQQALAIGTLEPQVQDFINNRISALRR